MEILTPKDLLTDDRFDDTLWDDIQDLRATPAPANEDDRPQITDLPTLHIVPHQGANR